MRFRGWLHRRRHRLPGRRDRRVAAAGVAADRRRQEAGRPGRPRAAQAEASTSTPPRRTASPRSTGPRSATTCSSSSCCSRAGANAKASTRYNITPLYLAAVNGNAAIIERLLKAGADPNGTVAEGQTMLMTAALSGKADAVQAAADARREGRREGTVQGSDRADVGGGRRQHRRGRRAARSRRRPQAKSTGGFTPLLFAVRNAHIETAVALLKRGANVNDVAPDGSSALSMAAVNAYFELASVLLDHGAESEPARSARRRRSTPWRGCASRAPTAPPASATRRMGTPQQTGKVTAIQLREEAARARRQSEHRASSGRSRRSARKAARRAIRRTSGSGGIFSATSARRRSTSPPRTATSPLMRLLVEFKAPTRRSPTMTGITPLMVAAGLDYWEGETPGPFTGVLRSGAARGGEAGASSWATTSTRAPTSATTRWTATSTTRCSTTRTTSTSCSSSASAIRAGAAARRSSARSCPDQPSIVQYLRRPRRRVDAQTRRWAGRRCKRGRRRVLRQREEGVPGRGRGDLAQGDGQQ